MFIRAHQPYGSKEAKGSKAQAGPQGGTEAQACKAKGSKAQDDEALTPLVEGVFGSFVY